MPAYLGRAEANTQYGGGDGHLYQGDLLQAVEFMVQLPDGVWSEKLWDAMVISHDCEFTKIQDKPSRPLLVAPVRSLSDYQQAEDIRQGKQYSLWALPREEPVSDDEYVVDFRLIQPLALRQLQDVKHWACLAPETRDELRGRVQRFLFRGYLGAAK